MLKTEKSMC